LQQTYHDLGHCSVRVTLAAPAPQDGVVTFRLADMPASETRDCLPVVALDAQAAPRPAQPASVSGASATFAYTDARDTSVAPPPRAPSPAPVAAGTPAPVAAANDSSVAGTVAAPYIEGVDSTKRLHLTEETQSIPATAPEKVTVAAADKVGATAPEKVTVAAVDRVSATAPETIAVAQEHPVAAAPAARQEPASVPAVVVAQAEPVKPRAAAPAKPAAAAPEVPESPTFEIRRFAVEGNTLLKQERIDSALASYMGAGKDFGDVQRALEALQLAYQQEGFGAVEIRLPEQELNQGEVKFRVIEPKVRRVLVEGNQHYSEENVRRSVPGLRVGETPRSAEIASNIRLANENPSKQSTVLLRSTDREDQLDATIRVADVDPGRFSVSFDNTGAETTHRYRVGLAYQHANLWQLDHVLTAQFITSPANHHDVYVYGLGYRMPFYPLGGALDVIAGYSTVDSGTVGELFTVAGKGAIYAARYTQNLPRWGELDHRIIVGVDYRAYQNNVVPVGATTQLVPDITLHPASVTYAASTKLAQRDLSMYLGIAQNIPGGNDGRDDDFKLVGARFQEGTAGYRLFRFGASLGGQLAGDWQFRIRGDGQYTDDALISGEMFAIGGADNVRGFNERYTSNDKGYRSSWEIYTPDLAKLAKSPDSRLRLLVFYDTGHVRRNRVLQNELHAASLDSGGVGLRFNYKDYFTLRFDVAYVFHDGTQLQEPIGRRSSKKGHVSMAWVW
jgi:hemolysin activation/secretion protein